MVIFPSIVEISILCVLLCECCVSGVCLMLNALPVTDAARSKLLGLLEDMVDDAFEPYLLRAFEIKAVVLIGDLGKPLLGLDEAVFEDLASTVDAIVHNGAHVNHLLPYQSMFWHCLVHTYRDLVAYL